jgi:hypothetical protein
LRQSFFLKLNNYSFINLVEATAAGMPGVSTYGAIKPISTGDINFIYQQGRLQSIGPQSILYKVQNQK